jgi:hypothetical protein
VPRTGPMRPAADGQAAGHPDAPAGGLHAIDGVGMSEWLVMSKRLADRRSLSRILFLMAIDPAATVKVPVTWPAAVTVPLPVTWRKTPWSGRRPQVCPNDQPLR